MSHKIKCSFFLIFITIGLAACTAGAPKQIAAIPREDPIAQYPSQTIIIYRAYLELKVSNVDQAVERATRLANDYGGYLSGSQSWFADGRKITTLELAVPTVNFESLRMSLRGLGDLMNESVSGEPKTGSGFPEHFSTITLQLRPGRISLPAGDTGGWNPLSTVQRAFQVFLTIFGFLADIVIWVLIVGGPFFLIYLGFRIVLRRLRRTSP
jgi:hypothetical protein